MDVFVSASLQEGLGLSIIEAMGCGIPVAGAASGGVVEIIEDKINGLLFGNEEENCMVSKIRLLLKDISLSRKISFNARKTVIKKFSMETAGFLTAETYKKVL